MSLKTFMNWNRHYVQNIRESAAKKQSALAWKTINEISHRNCKSKLQTASEVDKLNKCQAHFQKLLSSTI